MSRPEIRPALRAVERAGGKAIASLCLLAGVSEEQFRAVLAPFRQPGLSREERADIELKLARALGIGEPVSEPARRASLPRSDWPETALRDLQILRGVDTVQESPPTPSSLSPWILYTSLALYAALSLAYALSLHEHL